MRRISGLLAMCLAWLAASAGAQAQIKDDDVRLYLDGSVVSWIKQTTNVEGLGLEAEGELKTIGSGLLAGGGVGVGYAVTPHLLPELYVALQNLKVDLGDGNDTIVRQWELRPSLELALMPDARVVPFVVGGMTLGRAMTKDDETDLTMFGLGPALSIGAHAFLTARASLDLSFTFRGTFFVKNDLDDAAGAAGEVKIKQYALLLNLGASFWL